MKIPTGIPLSLAHLSEIETPPLALIDAAATGGFASIGLRTSPASPGGPVYTLSSEAEQDAVCERLSETGVEVLYIELITLAEGTRASDYKDMFRIGRSIGASRVAVAGDGKDLKVIGQRMAEICDLAADFKLSVDIEFMPYRGVASLKDAMEVVAGANRDNAHILLDALHFHRSGSSLDDLHRIDPGLLGSFQICDGPALAPDDLVAEARLNRQLPGNGEFALWSLIDLLPDGVPIGVEVSLYTSQPSRTVAQRLTSLAQATRNFIAQRNAS